MSKLIKEQDNKAKQHKTMNEDDLNIADLLKKKEKTPENQKKDGKHHFNRKKAILNEINNASQQPSAPLLNKILKETTSPNNAQHAAKLALPEQTEKSKFSVQLPTPQPAKPSPAVRTAQQKLSVEKKEERRRKRKKKEEKRLQKKKKKELEKAETQVKELPPDPGYIPNVRITTFSSLAGSSLFQSTPFKPGEARTQPRSRRRGANYESKKEPSKMNGLCVTKSVERWIQRACLISVG